jgi:carboxymethylenebutenolidase
MIERQIEIQTADGRMNTFICHPERLGPHPAVIFLMDAPGIREELRDMARRLGTVGYEASRKTRPIGGGFCRAASCK